MKSRSVLTITAAALVFGLASPAAWAASADSAAPQAGITQRLAQTPLPRCLLYSSTRITAQGMMRCSYQCGDRIIIRGGQDICPQSVARPAAQ